MIMGIILGAVLLVALVWSLCVFAAKKKKLEMQRAFVVKHGKATLAVVAALAFGAGALAPSAASRVSQMKMFQTYQGTKVAEDSQVMSTTGVGGDGVGYNAAVPIQTNAGTTNDGGETIRK